MTIRPSIRNRLSGTNVPPAERVVSALFGAAAIGFGLRQRGFIGWSLVGLGAVLAVRGVTGRCPVYRANVLRRGITVHRSVIVQATPQQIYELLRSPTNLPKFMEHVESVEVEHDGAALWTVKEGPAKLQWRAVIVEDTPAKRLVWRSLPGGAIDTEGSFELHEATGGRGTIVAVKLRYMPPGGAPVAGVVGNLLRRITGVQLGQELARLQQLIEVGELTTNAPRPEDVTEREKLGSAVEAARSLHNYGAPSHDPRAATLRGGV
ncbi:MAG: SRPBCC family protein [Kofleriaceae bacterium]